MEGEGNSEKKGTVCVTGAGGFIASWLVKLLLADGYKVHGTVRDPDDEKNAHLLRLDKASESLRLFKADLLDYDSLSAAIAGCQGVFHAACPVPSQKVANPEQDMVVPAVTGTLNVLKACSEVKVGRIIVVSSCVSVSMNPNWPGDKVMNEDCWSDKEYCKKTENWYFYSKTMAEELALDYGKEHRLAVVTALPPAVFGPLLQPTVNASSLLLLNLVKGVRDTVDNRLLSVVDVRDLAEALLMLYENPEATGRYICSSYEVKLCALVSTLKGMYPVYKYPKNFTDVTHGPPLTSEKLKALGWKHRELAETLADSVKCFQKAGLLDE